LAFLDWTRGVAAVVMLNGHVFHSFARPESREGSAYLLTQFMGGMPPAIFLFLLGITLAFLMESKERKGVPPGQRVRAALLRSAYLFGLAFLFRIQLWAFGLPKTQWADLFRVDILNAMGLAVALMSGLAAFRTADRVRAGLGIGLAIAFLSPVMSTLGWSWAPALVRSYIVPDLLTFAFFPWGAYVAFGVSAGSAIRLVRRDQIDRLLPWAALLGLALIQGGRFCYDLPYSLYAGSEFWLNSPWLILIKLGLILLLLAAAFVWTEYAGSPGWSWIRQFGTTSLLIYWVHTELVYGRWLYFLKERLTPAQAALASVGVILLMLGLASLKTHWRSLRHVRLRLVPFPYVVPRRVPGD
jgi:hypothetical protein